MKDIVTALKERREKLLKVANSEYPIDPKHRKAHSDRVFAASEYIKEIDSLIPTLSVTAADNIYIVPINIFEKKLERADYATIEDEGFYFRMAHVTNFPSEEFTLLYLAPLSSI